VLFTKKIFTTEIAEKRRFFTTKFAEKKVIVIQASNWNAIVRDISGLFQGHGDKLVLLYLLGRLSGCKWIPLSEIRWI
jgi:hypothetical protein